MGGCPWELSELIKEKARGKSVKQICSDFIEDKYGEISLYRFNLEDKELKKEFDSIIKTIVEKGFYTRNDNENTKLVKELLKQCIELDIWFYIAKKNQIIANSRSIFHAFKKIVEFLKNNS